MQGGGKIVWPAGISIVGLIGLYYWTQQRCYLLLHCAALSGHGLLPHRHTLGTEATLLHDPMAHTQVLHTAGWLVTHPITTRACKH